MILVAITALLAVCGAAKLDRTYLPPSSAATAGGSPESLQTPFLRSSEQEKPGDILPTGSYTNDFQGVVVDAAAPGIRASPGSDLSGLGGSRDSYGSENSKVGDAAFRGSIAGFRNTPNLGSGLNGQVFGIKPGQNFDTTEPKSERPQAFKDRNSNIISYANDVSIDNYSYGFESDNGIAVGENGVANNGIQKQGGYSYKGDDGQVYKVTYVADERGYRPEGAHLPTPPPIPKEILESLAQNAKDEAAGLIDDGSYDAQKYNAEGDYTHHNSGNIQYNGAQLSQFAKRPESDATASNTFINQNSQAFGKPGQLSNIGAQNTPSNFKGQSNQFSSSLSNNQERLPETQNKQTSHVISGRQQISTTHHGSGHFGQNSGQLGQTQDALGNLNAQPEYQNNQQVPNSQFGTQSIQFGSQVNQQGSFNHLGGEANQIAPVEHSFGHGTNSAYNSQISHGSNQAIKPQSPSGSQVQNGSGQLSQYNNNNKQENSQASQTQFGNAGLNKPSFSSFVNNKLLSGQGQISNNGNQFANTQNLFGAEYLPPSNSNNGPSSNKPQINAVSSTNDANRDNQIPDFIDLKGKNQDSSASAFASVTSSGLGSQPARPFNAFQSENPRPNQFNYNNNNQLSSIEQTQSNDLPNSSKHSGSNAVPAVPTKPTIVPQTELTTPFESNEKYSYSQGSQSNGQSTSNFGVIGSQTISNPVQSQSGFEKNFASATSQQSTGYSSSYPDSRLQETFQFDSSSPTPPTFPASQRPGSDEKTQFPQNTGSLNQQNNLNVNQQQNNVYYSTQKPSFSQGPDDSYYYNQPSKPFGIPTTNPQGSRFPSSPSYQSNSVVSSQSNSFSKQQGSLTSSTKFPTSLSMASVVPTSVSQVTQNQDSAPTNYYNGITQASISPFPPVSATTSTQYDTNRNSKFGSNAMLNRPSVLQPQSNKPTSFQQNFGVPSFPTKPGNAFAPNPSTSFSQNQDQFDQNTLPNNYTQTQQYQGTLYEYNKPAEVLPAPENTDTSSSQNVQSNLPSKPQGQVPTKQESKPQFGLQTTQSVTFSQQTNLNQGSKPQLSTQTFKPFDASNTLNSQFSQSSQSNLQHSTSGSPGVSKSSQISSGSGPRFGSQPSKLFSSASTLLQIGQNTQQPQSILQTAGFTSTLQTQELQSNEQPLKPQSSVQSTTFQFGQNTQATFRNTTAQQSSGPLLTAQPNKPSYGTSSPPNYGQAAQTQGSPSTGFASTQMNSQNSQISEQTIKPFGMTGTSQSFQGHPSSKPQFSSQFTQNQFSPSFQQTFGATQINSQSTAGLQNGGHTFGNAPLIHDSPDSQKPQFGQHVNSQETQLAASSFGQQIPIISSQFGSIASKPQFGTQTQYTQNQNPSSIKPFNNALAQIQSIQNTAQVSSSAVTQQIPQGTQTYKPFGASFNKGSSVQQQNKPQFDQASQLSQTVSTTSSPPQFGVQAFKPFGSSGSQEPQNEPGQGLQTKPFSAQQGSPCCQGSKDSSITPLNVGKPSQAFAQTQSQFTAFQGDQSLNAQSVAGKGEQFDGPRQPPSFDSQTGYHYRK